MYEIEKTPEEFEEASHEVLLYECTPSERRSIRSAYQEGGYDALLTIADERIDKELKNRDDYVEAIADGWEAAINEMD